MSWRYRNHDEQPRVKTEVEQLFPEKPMIINPFKIYYDLVEGAYEMLKGAIEVIENKCSKWGDDWRGSGKYALVSLPAGIAASNVADSHRWFRNSGWSTFAYTLGTIGGVVAGGMTAFNGGTPEAINSFFNLAQQTQVTDVGSFFTAMKESTGSMLSHGASFIAGGAIGGPAGFLGTVGGMFLASTAGATAFSMLKSARNFPVAIQRWNYTRKKIAAEKATPAKAAPAAPVPPLPATPQPQAGNAFNQTSAQPSQGNATRGNNIPSIPDYDPKP